MIAMDVIDKYGADALRWFLCMTVPDASGHFWMLPMPLM